MSDNLKITDGVFLKWVSNAFEGRFIKFRFNAFLRNDIDTDMGNRIPVQHKALIPS